MMSYFGRVPTLRRPILVILSWLSVTAPFALAATLPVTNTNDSGTGSLRQAILDANASVGVPDTIIFKIPGTGVKTITPASAFPAITDPVVIDGYTQSGSSANTLAVGNNAVLLIEINGTNAPGAAFTLNADNSTFKGLVINRFPSASFNAGYAFRLFGAGNTIQGCFLGTTPAGNTASPNAFGGVSIEATSNSAIPSGNNLIGGPAPAARNLIVGGSQGSAIDIEGFYDIAQNIHVRAGGNTVQGNYIGTNAAGSAMLGRSGIEILTANNLIGGTAAGAGNVMFSNGGLGLSLREANASGNTIQGNFIGINAKGTASLGGNTDGINLVRAPTTTIGGTVAGAGNVISGNGGIGITAAESDNLIIQGNLIGTNAAGTIAVPNPGGIGLSGGINGKIGGTTPGARNIISGNSNIGMRLSLFKASSGNLIQGNYIGTDITGTKALGNGGSGLQIFASEEPASPNAVTVGGTTTAARNLISASTGNGILLQSSNILIQGNYIGTDVNGTGDLGNGASGIFVQNSKDTIGGAVPGAGNLIAFNGKTDAGVSNSNGIYLISSATGDAILGNSIFSNAGIGIDLPGGGENSFFVTPNDSGDADTGANNLQNYPVLTSVTSGNGFTTIIGTLNSMANTTYRIEFFANNSIGPSGYGEGQTFIGATNVTTDGNGNASFNFKAPQIAGIQRVTSTATDPSGNTSEFSAAIGQLLNISTRLKVQTGDKVLIAGFIISGSDPKKVIVRGIGPSLNGSVPGFLADPILELHDSATTLATNDNWKVDDQTHQSQQAEIEATTIPPTNDLESALVRTLPAGNAGYTAVLRGKSNSTGIGVVEAYDLNQAAHSKFANISTRGLVETGDQILIGGFIAGNGVTKVVARAIGPSLGNFGIQGALQDPTLELHNGSGTIIASNDDWKLSSSGASQQAEIEATKLAPTNNFESALVQSLVPGNYTAVVQGKSATTGIAVVEVYNVQ